MSEKSGLEKAYQFANMCRKLANIAKAALISGIKGAIVETAKSFTPTVIKIIVGVLIVLILMPFLVVAALPNIFFGFKTTSASDVLAMTDKAKVIEDAYKSTRDYNEKEVKKIIDSMSEGYDDVELTEDLGNSNDYWFIAICSVAYKQDLFAMNPEDVKSKSIFGFLFDSKEETYTEGEGDTMKQLKRIRITVKDMNPEELMDELKFTDEMKNWARTIYNTMVDDQNIRPGDPNYDPTSPGYDGDIIYSEGQTPIVYYNQRDSRWGGKLYGRRDTIAVAGCGPTSLAIVVSSLTSQTIDPGQMADWAYKNGYRVEGAGSSHALIPDGARHFGLNVQGITKSQGQKIVDALSSGKLVVAIMGPGHFTTFGHFIVLRGVTASGKILVADPYTTSNNNKEWSLSLIISEARNGAGAGGPFWAIGG